MSTYIYEDGAIHNDHHKEMTVNVTGKTDIAALMKSFMEEEAMDVQEELVSSSSKRKERLSTEYSFIDIVQYENPEVFIKRLHQLIDGRKGADVGCVLLKCIQDGYLTRRPTKKEFESEFTLEGGWTAIHNYMSDNNYNALDRANKIVIF